MLRVVFSASAAARSAKLTRHCLCSSIPDHSCSPRRAATSVILHPTGSAVLVLAGCSDILRRCEPRGLPHPAALRLNSYYKGYRTHVPLATIPLSRSAPQRLQPLPMSILHSLFGMRRKSDAPPPDSRTSTHASPEDVTRELGMMNLRTQPQRHAQVQVQSQLQPPQQDGSFVGGFHPAAVGGNVPYATSVRSGPTFPNASTPPHPGPPPVPPKIVNTSPVDKRGISRTMEYALSSPGVGTSGSSRPSADRLQRPSLDASRPRSDPAAYTRPPADRTQPVKPLPLFRDGDDPPSISAPPQPSSSRLPQPSLQVPISLRGRSTSSPATSPSSDLPPKVNCSGFTKASKPCKRQIDRSALTMDSSTWYCHQHEPERLKNKKFRLPNGDFDDYKSTLFLACLRSTS